MKKSLKKLKVSSTNWAVSTGQESLAGSKKISSYSPVDGVLIGEVEAASKKQYEGAIKVAQTAFLEWRNWPAPKRGEIVRQIGNALRAQKEELGQLVSYEMGKSLQEGLGEVQEMIDIADFAVGLSRQLHGLTMHSERPNHRMYEQYHPLGVVGVISAFNFPVAVWSWNAFIAWVCGDVCVWKPSEKVPLCAVACQEIVSKVLKQNKAPEGLSVVIQGGRSVGEWMAADERIPLISATGSTRMGRSVAATVGQRLGKSLLELGGNNAIIISPDADLNTALPAVIFGAVGTSGQRCTTTRRVIVHEQMEALFIEKLLSAYQQLKIGNPLEPQIHVGPLIDESAVKEYKAAIKQAKAEGGNVLVGGSALSNMPSKCYVQPTVIKMPKQSSVVTTETFAPILYVLTYRKLEQAIELQNAVPQGLSSAIMTQNLKEAEQFLSARGSDCGIANVNIGTSGAEIGGAFGGEKETGGGRESGSDAWKIYMRRQTNTINYGDDLPLAQGIIFN